MSARRIVTGSGADRVPPSLRKVLDVDVRLTKAFVDGAAKVAPQVNTASFISYLKALEVSTAEFIASFEILQIDNVILDKHAISF